MRRLHQCSIRKLRGLLGACVMLAFFSSIKAHANGEPATYLGTYPADAIFILEKTGAHKGDTVTLKMSIESYQPIQGFDFAITVDLRLLDIVSVTPILAQGKGWDTFDLQMTSRENTLCEQNPCVRNDVYGRVVFSETDSGADLPAKMRNDVLELTLKIHDDAPSGLVDVDFSELFENPAVPGTVTWTNDILLRGGGTGHVFYSDVRFLGRILVDPPVGVPFLRGDVNADGQISISDATMIRRWNFPGSLPSTPCTDAADVDDNGEVQITDAIGLFHHLFLSPIDDLSHIEAPYPAVGLDANLDALSCGSYPLQDPEETDDLVRLGGVGASPGESVSVPIFISSAVPIEGFQLIVSYDPALFSPQGPNLDLSGTVFESQHQNSFNSVSTTLADGLIAIGFVGDLLRPGFVFPAGEDVLAGKLKGTVAAGLAPGTEIRLELTNGPDGAGVGPKKLRNELTHDGSARLVSVIPRLEGMVFGIVSDITFFRGDTNSDEKVDVSDAVATLGYLFLGDAAPLCPDAADADDSGIIDLSDAVLTLNFLFHGGARLALPHPRRGNDYEPDDLGPCLTAR